jgi:hypothetical protein
MWRDLEKLYRGGPNDHLVFLRALERVVKRAANLLAMLDDEGRLLDIEQSRANAA